MERTLIIKKHCYFSFSISWYMWNLST